MPQLDKFTYFTQFFWSCLFLFTFYIAIWNDGDGLLGISRILKLRNQLLSHQENNIRSKDPNSLEDILRKGFSTGVSYMYSSLFEVSQWCNAVDLLGKRRRIPLISCFGEISGSRGMERNIFYLISKSSYSTSSNPGWGITCRNDITLIHVPRGQRSFDNLYTPMSYLLNPNYWVNEWITGMDKKVLDETCFEKNREQPPRTSSHKKNNQSPRPPLSVLLDPFFNSKNEK
uniref:H(+)-transporting two-sector ATPase n=1 Tax=Daucus carota TaxID=4039 RepID=Q9GBR7_DAUCA|nr:orfB-F2 [Daucus carota]